MYEAGHAVQTSDPRAHMTFHDLTERSHEDMRSQGTMHSYESMRCKATGDPTRTCAGRPPARAPARRRAACARAPAPRARPRRPAPPPPPRPGPPARRPMPARIRGLDSQQDLDQALKHCACAAAAWLAGQSPGARALSATPAWPRRKSALAWPGTRSSTRVQSSPASAARPRRSRQAALAPRRAGQPGAQLGELALLPGGRAPGWGRYRCR